MSIQTGSWWGTTELECNSWSVAAGLHRGNSQLAQSFWECIPSQCLNSWTNRNNIHIPINSYIYCSNVWIEWLKILGKRRERESLTYHKRRTSERRLVVLRCRNYSKERQSRRHNFLSEMMPSNCRWNETRTSTFQCLSVFGCKRKRKALVERRHNHFRRQVVQVIILNPEPDAVFECQSAMEG